MNINYDVLKTLFPQIKDYSKLKLDDVGLYSITSLKSAKIISEIIKSYFPSISSKELTITDATSGLGGNVFSFSEFFKSVNAVEKDTNRYTMLEKNLELYKKEFPELYQNIKLYNKNYLEIMLKLEQDIIFFDPPWGGRGYKEQDNIDLFLDQTNIITLCNQLEKLCRLIAIKVPTNFNFNNFVKLVNNKKVNIYKLQKMNLIVIKNQ
jgi:site-specific DNA-adenine methylase